MEQTEKRSFRADIFFHNFWLAFKKAFWLPVLLAVLAGGFRYVTQIRSYRPVYVAKANFAVSANNAAASDISSVSYYYDTSAASMLATTFSYVLQTDVTKQLLQEKTGSSHLNATVTAVNIADSNWLEISATASSASAAYEAIQTVVEIYPQAAVNVLGTTTLQQLGEPVIPDKPINPFQPLSGIFKFALAGLAVGLALIALMAYLRRTVHSAEDLNALINMPCLGYLPTIRMKKRSSKAEQALLVSNPRLSSGYVEAIHTIRYHFLKELEQSPAKVIMVTSTLPGEGKTTVSSNLALALAEQNKRVILVDGDLRKPSVKKQFCMTEPSEGLPEILRKKEGGISTVQVPNSALLLLAGDKAANEPQALLSSRRMKAVLSELQEQADYVIIDTPPAAFLSDAAALTEMVDGVVYVTRQDYANQTAILNSVQSLAGMDARFIGCVLNNTAISTTRYGYGRGSRYGYGYGYGYGYEKNEKKSEL